MQKQFASWEFLMCRNMQSVSFPTQLNSHNSARQRKKIKHSKSSATVITTKMKVMEKLNPLWRLLRLLRKIWEKNTESVWSITWPAQHTYGWHDNIYRTNVDKRSNKNWNTHESNTADSEDWEQSASRENYKKPEASRLLWPECQRFKWDKPGNTVIIKPKGLRKGQGWNKRNCLSYRIADTVYTMLMCLDGKLSARNRVETTKAIYRTCSMR